MQQLINSKKVYTVYYLNIYSEIFNNNNNNNSIINNNNNYKDQIKGPDWLWSTVLARQ